jgi:sulfite reductase alpha subunit-like flavoprotein
MDKCDVSKLPDSRYVFLVCSTFGEGEFPDNAKNFWAYFSNSQLPASFLDGVQFSVCGLGSMDYSDTFNEAAKLLQSRCLNLGGEAVVEPVYCDEKSAGGFMDGFDTWATQVKNVIGGSGEPRTQPNPSKYTISLAFTRKNTKMVAQKRQCPPGFSWATLVGNDMKTAPGYDREVRQFDIDLKGTGLDYTTGDHIEILPQNPDEVVNDFSEFYGLCLNECIAIKPVEDGVLNPFPTNITVYELLKQYLDLNAPPNRKVFDDLLLFAVDEKELKVLNEYKKLAADDKEEFAMKMKEYSYATILKEFPNTMAIVPLEQLLSIIPLIKPRLYSIASSSLMHPQTIQVAIVLFNWATKGGLKRTGLSTGYLFSLELGAHIAINTKKGLLRFSEHPERPMVCFGLGTGIGVFRGFVQERLYLKEQGVTLGPMHLWQACRYHDKDFVYADENKIMIKKGVLDKHHAAFSHDDPNKFVTIPYLMDEEPERMISMAKANDVEMYYCGPAFGIPNSIMESVTRSLVKGGMPDKAALKHVSDMKKDRWFVECYSV